MPVLPQPLPATDLGAEFEASFYPHQLESLASSSPCMVLTDRTNWNSTCTLPWKAPFCLERTLAKTFKSYCRGNLMNTKGLAEFGDFQLDLEQRVLLNQGEPIPLPPKDIETLLVLVESQGRIVEKRELMEKVWPATFVEESNLTRHIFNLRQALANGKDRLEYIETVPKRGYRFICPVSFRDAQSCTRPEITAVADRPAGLSQPPAFRAMPWRRRAVQVFGITITLFLALATAGYRYRGRADFNAKQRPRVMLAVLPVQNLTGDPKLEYVNDGLTEELIAQLGELSPRNLGVIARTSSMAYKNTNKTIGQIARELGVDYVLETSLRESSNDLRFTAQLIDTRDQTHIWAREYDQKSGDWIAVQDEIGRSVAAQISVQLSPNAEKRAAQKVPIRADSYESYLQGLFNLNRRSKDGLDKAVDNFATAIQQDPKNARAYAGLSNAYSLMAFYGFQQGPVPIIQAQEAARKAIETDGDSGRGHAALAYVDFMWLWRWNDADREFRRAIELNHNSLLAHHWYALYLSALNRPQEAIEQIQIAETLDPRSPIVKSAAAWIYYFARKPKNAEAKSLEALELNPDFMVGHATLGLAYEEQGRFDLATSEFKEAIKLSGIQQPTYLGYLGHAYGASGHRAEAEKVLKEFDELTKKGYLGITNVAIVYAGIGDKDRAFSALQDATGQQDASRVWINVNPQLDNLRSDPRFQNLIRSSWVGNP